LVPRRLRDRAQGQSEVDVESDISRAAEFVKAPTPLRSRFGNAKRGAHLSERIKELQPWFRGDYVIVLKDNRKLTLSRTYRGRLNL
jgi:hypothetical protein